MVGTDRVQCGFARVCLVDHKTTAFKDSTEKPADDLIIVDDKNP